MFGANFVKGDVISEPDGEHFHLIKTVDFFSELLNVALHSLYYNG